MTEILKEEQAGLAEAPRADPNAPIQGNVSGEDLSGVVETDPIQVEPLRTGGLEGSAVAGLETLVGGFQAVEIGRAKAWAKFFNPGPHLTPDEWKKSIYARPGLSVPEGGIGENNAKINAHVFDSRLRREAIINDMAPGLISSIEKFGGQTVGFAIDPINHAVGGAFEAAYVGTKAGMWIGSRVEGALFKAGAKAIPALEKLAPSIVPKIEAGTLRGVAKAGGKLGATVAGGLGEGVALGIPGSADDMATDSLIGAHINYNAALTNIGLFAVLGGATRGLLHTKFTMKPLAHQRLIRTAIGQLLEGKKVNLKVQIKAEYDHQRLHESNIDPAKQQVATEMMQKEFDKRSESLKDAKTKLDTEETSFKKTTGKALKDVPQSGGGILSRAAALLLKDPLERTQGERSFLNNLPATPEMSRAVEILGKDPRDVSEKENTFMKEMTSANGEEKIIRERLKREGTKKAIKETKDKNEREGALQEVQTKNDRARLDELKKIKVNGTPELRKARAKHTQESFAHTNTSKLKDSNDAYNSLKSDDLKRVTPSEVKTDSDTIHSAEGDSTHDQGDLDELAAEQEAIKGDTPQAEFKDEAEEVDDLLKAGKLDDFDKKILEDYKREDKVTSKLPKVLEAYSNCVISLGASQKSSFFRSL